MVTKAGNTEVTTPGYTRCISTLLSTSWVQENPESFWLTLAQNKKFHFLGTFIYLFQIFNFLEIGIVPTLDKMLADARQVTQS